MGHSIGVAHDPSAPAGHLPALRAGRKSKCVHTVGKRKREAQLITGQADRGPGSQNPSVRR